jgi:hypothetical protein
MKYGNATVLCMLSLSVVWGFSGGCGGDGNGSVFQTGGGSLTGGSGSTLAGGTQAGGTLTGVISGGSTTGGSPTGGNTGTGSITDACATQASDSNSIPTDIFIMLDKSGSMSCPAVDSNCESPPNPIVHPTRWEAFTQAVTGFVTARTSMNIGVGIGYFSLGNNACSANAYAMPTVAIAPLPGNAMAITNAIGMLMPGGNTPTVPALQGALQYATNYTKNTPGRGASVVFVTDGIPNGCNSTIAAAATLAQNAFAGTPSIKTYVVGLGNTAALDQIALAGSGGTQHYFPAQGDVAGQLAAALTTISGAVTCDYVIPTNAMVDPTNVNIEVTLGGGMAQTVGHVADAANCGPMGGWYYDNNTKPTKITLCPQSCDPLKATPNSKVQVIYGCPTKGPGVN